MPKPIVAIVGRPNVGKSTLFNRIAGKRIAIVEDMPGITRDRIYADAEWQAKEFTLIDTGGIEFTQGESIQSQTRKQAEIAMEEADVIIFLVDAKEGITPSDYDVANILRKTKKPILLVPNKADNPKMAMEGYEFYSLGLGEPIPISSAHGMNTGDLLDEVIKLLPEKEDEEYPPDTIKVAVIGRPNVGKSSLINAILGEERVIVSDIAGTTRDAIDTFVKIGEESFVFIDTAGLRKRGKISESVERYSVMRTLRAVERADVVLMLIDATTGVTEQDKRIAGYAFEAGKGCLLVVNKWDLIEKDTYSTQNFTEEAYKELPFLTFAPVTFVSAKTGRRVPKIIEFIIRVAEEHARRVPTNLLNTVLQDAVAMHHPPSVKGKRVTINYATQVQVKPPVFLFFSNHPELIHFSYERYLENALRENFGFEGAPLKLVMKKKGED